MVVSLGKWPTLGLLLEENQVHSSLKFPWMNQSAGVKDMLMFNTKFCTVLKLLPGPLLQESQLCCCMGLNITRMANHLCRCLTAPVYQLEVPCIHNKGLRKSKPLLQFLYWLLMCLLARKYLETIYLFPDALLQK